ITWQKNYGSVSFDAGGSIIQTTDGGYILAGTISAASGDVTESKGGNDVWVAKLNDTGAILWQKTYGGTSSDDGVMIKETTDGGYIFIANTSSTDGDITGTNHGGSDVWVVKINATGDITWQKTLGGS